MPYCKPCSPKIYPGVVVIPMQLWILAEETTQMKIVGGRDLESERKRACERGVYLETDW